MRAAGLLVGAVLLGTFAFFCHDGGFNQNVRFDLTRAIVEHGTLTIDAYHQNTQDKAYRGGHYYCDKPPGVSLLAVPGYFASYNISKLFTSHPTGRRAQRWGFYVARVTAVSFFGAALGVVFLWAIAPFCGSSWAVFVTVGLGLGTLIFPYSTIFYGHQVAGTLLFCAFALLFTGRRRWTLTREGHVLAGFAAAAAGVVDYPAFLLAGLLGVYVLAAPALRSRVGWFAAGAALPVAGLMVYHTVCFGAPFSTGFAHEALSLWRAKYGAGFYGLGPPRAEALYQLTAGPRRGLFYQAPWLLLFVPGLWHLVVSRRWWAEAALVAAMFAVMLCLNASLHTWGGGWTMGARYLIPVVPFLAFAAAFTRGRIAWAAAVVLVPVSVVFMLAGAAVMPEVPVLVPNPLRDFLLPYLFHGKLSIADPAGEAFNLGESVAGLSGVWSLLPLLGLWSAGAIGLWSAVRRGSWPRAR